MQSHGEMGLAARKIWQSHTFFLTAPSDATGGERRNRRRLAGGHTHGKTLRDDMGSSTSPGCSVGMERNDMFIEFPQSYC